MEKVINLFHYLSYIKYPILLVGLYFFYKPIFSDLNNLFESYNSGLIFIGLGMGLDSLKDYGKLTWIDKKVYHKPNVAKYYFLCSAIVVLSLIILGAVGYLSSEQSTLKDVSIGFIVLGIGTLGVLKAGILATKDFMENEVGASG